MNSHKHTVLRGIAIIAFGIATLAPGVTRAQENTEPQDMEVLTRGPVHEAFAGTVSFNPEPGIIVTSQVPEMIEEVPPEQQLEGDNVAWIPGYWAWDEEQNDFLWISGVWRNLPPGRQWVPGYWSDVDGGYQWTSGYWEDAETDEVTYLPEPPRTLEAGPNVAAPSNDQTWIPGNWLWQDTRYVWRAGYWTPARESWIWVPGHYVWTHRGYVYVDGYWDYAVPRRGVLFAPVHFHRRAYVSPGFYYSPATVISLVVFTNHLFLRPNYCHYYFGDYYAPRYRNRGYFASYSYYSSRRGYDPIYSYYRWENRNVRNWEKQRRDYYEFRRDHRDARPPRTWAALNALPQEKRGSRRDYALAEPLSQYAGTRRDGSERFRKLAKNDRERIVARTQDMRNFTRERKQLETRQVAAATGTAAEAAASSKVSRTKFKRSPVVATVNESSDKSIAPPKRLEKRAFERTKGSPKTASTAGKPDVNREAGATQGRKPAQAAKSEKTGRSERQTTPQPSKKAQSQTKRQTAIPSSEGTEFKKSSSTDATPERKSATGKKRDTVSPPAVQKAESGTQATPSPARQTTPEQKRQKAPATRKATPASSPSVEQPRQTKRQQQAQPQRQQAQPQRQQAQPQRKQQAQPQRQQAQPQQKSSNKRKSQSESDSDTSGKKSNR